MAVSRVKVWGAETLTYQDLNAEYNNILNNGTDVAFPLTKTVDGGGYAFTGMGNLTFNTGKTETLTAGSVYWAKGANLASAATLTLGADGNLFHVTGVTPITAISTVQAGTLYALVFDGILAFTHNATTLILPGGASITTAVNDVAIMVSEGAGNHRCLSYVRASGLPTVVGTQGQALISNVTPAPVWGVPVLRSYLSGLTMSTAGSSTTMTIAAGQAADSTNVEMMTLASAIGKTTGAWAVGTGNGGLDTGAIANSTWYHFYLIKRTDTNVVDVLFSTSASAPTMPANYTPKRRIGSGRTDGSGNWVTFTQDGDYFVWAVTVADISAANPGTSAVTRTLTVPTGVNVFAKVRSTYRTSADDMDQHWVVLSDLAATDEAASTANASYGNNSAIAGVNGSAGELLVRTNTLAQIRSRVDVSTANTTLAITTIGWLDRRGRDL